jgi:FlaA1/EpsC-like NDP-sugar epimerase
MINRLYKHRELINSLIHIALFVVVFFLTFFFRFEFHIPPYYLNVLVMTLPAVVIIKFVVFYYFAAYKSSWRYAGVYDLVNIIKASSFCTLMLGLLIYFFYVHEELRFPRSIIILDWLLTIIVIGGAKLFLRIVREEFTGIFTRTGPGRKMLIVGAGNAGESLIREVKKYPDMNYQVVGLVDDDTRKINTFMHGVKIHGPIDKLPEIAEQLAADEILIAVPSASGDKIRRIVGFCEESGKPFKTIPSLDRLIDGRITVNKLREVEIDDLLRRDPVRLDTGKIENYLTGRSVMVTGAGGSIGSEICRQVMRFGPRVLIMVDQAESAIFEIERELIKYIDLPGRLVAKIGDICNEGTLNNIFTQFPPEVIFHCAAYKHVPLMEFNVREALRNNVLGTRILAQTAMKFGVESLVFISTDKAVNPSSVMGASKRLAEKYLQYISGRSKTRFVIVRFGNVLGSQGSAVEVFKKQIMDGGPVTVTHPEMRRYFMTIPEAAQLVLQAATIGKGGNIYFLDMGEPIKILDLARDLIRLSGLKPDEDIQIIFTGTRPGEKLFEELKFSDEGMIHTEHEKIYQVKMNGKMPDNLEPELEDLNLRLLNQADEEGLRNWLGSMVGEYKAWGSFTGERK